MRPAILVALTFTILAGCTDDEPDLSEIRADVVMLRQELQSAQARIEALETDLAGRVTTLETSSVFLDGRVTDVETESAANTSTLAATAGVVAAAGELQSFMSVTQNGDVLIEGANLQIASGSGSTDGTPNGKGNFILGYNELEREVGLCMGGTNNGNTCGSDVACPGGSCDKTAGVVRTGSHNIVVGSGQSYASYGSLLAGTDNTSNAPNSAILCGQNNVVGTDHSAIVGGLRNSVESGSRHAAILGGSDNATSADLTVVLGESSNTNNSAGTILP